jgi:hypothetical protein
LKMRLILNLMLTLQTAILKVKQAQKNRHKTNHKISELLFL